VTCTIFGSSPSGDGATYAHKLSAAFVKVLQIPLGIMLKLSFEYLYS